MGSLRSLEAWRVTPGESFGRAYHRDTGGSECVTRIQTRTDCVSKGS